MNKKLSDYAKENNIPYRKAWNMYKSGQLDDKIIKGKNGRIFIKQELENKTNKLVQFFHPIEAGGEKVMKASGIRRNAAATSNPTDEYYHIKNGVEPFAMTSGRNVDGGLGGMFPISEAIHLCQKAYYNFPVFRNIIDAQTEFSCSNIYLTGGNEKSVKFFTEFLDYIGVDDLQDKFFRELYRSCNSIIFRFEVSPDDSSLKNLNKTFGSNAKKGDLIPAKYIILNPYDIGVQSNILFASNCLFYKRLNGYEISQLKTRESDEAKMFYDSLPVETQKQIDAGAGTVIVPLNPHKITAVFYKKQDYEPMAVPIGFGVLKDIEWKAEMKHVDMAVARVMQQIVLVVNMGYESKDGNYMFDAKAAEAMQALFESESVGKVLVADFTTKLSWAIPTVGDFLDPKKYEIVNADIKEGLNYILTGGDSKFANQFISVKLFVERLKEGRKMFLNQFLIPEFKRISKIMGFKNYPTPKFEEIDLRDEAEWERIVTQLITIGALTPTEGLDSFDSGKLPTKEESLKAQEEYRKLRDKGFYEPIFGGPYNQNVIQDSNNDFQEKIQQKEIKPSTTSVPVQNAPPGQKGRPNGINTKQKVKKIRTASENDDNQPVELYSLSKFKDVLIVYSKLRELVSSKVYSLKNTSKEKASDDIKKIIDEISDLIICNASIKDWENEEIVLNYIKNPINNNEERLNKIDSLAFKHCVAPAHAALLFESEK